MIPQLKTPKQCQTRNDIIVKGADCVGMHGADFSYGSEFFYKLSNQSNVAQSCLNHVKDRCLTKQQ